MNKLKNLTLDPSRKDDVQIIGKTFNRLTCKQVAGYLQYSDRKVTAYLFDCSCGNQLIAAAKDIVSQHTKSCGCLRKEITKDTGKANTKPANANPAFERYFNQYKSQAKRRGLEFTLDSDVFKNIVTQDCHYCGHPPSKLFGNNWKGYSLPFVCNGVDRKDNSVGYTLKNSIPCCAMCNYAKKDYTYDYFINWAKRIGEFQNS